MRLDERKKKVLAAVVQDYILTGEPVGSRTIARRYDLGVSPATIRNEMADLEEMGLLEQPHTSAGRIPSDFGYRYYVDCLMAPERLTPAEEEYVRRRYNQKMLEIEQVLEETARLLSEMTAYTAVALGPCQTNAILEQVQILPVHSSNKALLVAVTSTGVVEHRIFVVPETVTPEDLSRISRVLNASLQGLALEELRQAVLRDIYREVAEHRGLIKQIIDLLQQILSLEGGEKVYLEGIFNILSQPEFKNLEKVKDILAFLEREEALRRIFNAVPTQGLTIRIGQENKEEGIDKCSVVTISYSVEGKIMGKVGLLGPTRMHYSRVISVLQCVADSLSRTLEQFYR
ncbi:MAG: heat-inducible transcription repressor HrcA [Moorella humiferrea]|uniref:Heat-inducible transcription repressor HrcA n=1 Tax=Neomoorella humiferrea TaxID=676965 RepID=A0A2T0AW14_9FIRM|nr:heat-inducible transcriptional repressor HrcA [Moorella humiferrea]MBE3573445.1 heat-inducible transcription repressor HrcA [Moorella humiferrea]PRR74934.1 Heat-inducible transcription repressor HrcA [Moorella humiferrea]